MSRADDCASALNWTDVYPMASTSVPWRGYNNSGASNNATIPSRLLSSSTIEESYVEENNSTGTPNQIDVGAVAEWDWVIEQNAATAGVLYCFRMVESDGSPFSAYENYPQIITNTAPNMPTQATPFSYEKVGTTTPAFQFVSSDPENNALDYQIQIDTAATFTSPIYDKDSLVDPELFENVPNPANKAPFNSGDYHSIQAVTALTNGVTYWWRVRSIDANGSNSWSSWSDARSFTVDTAVTFSTWFQTTRDQFQLDTLNGVNASNTDRMMLNVGSTTGTATSPTISFSDGSVGTMWGNLLFNDVENIERCKIFH